MKPQKVEIKIKSVGCAKIKHGTDIYNCQIYKDEWGRFLTRIPLGGKYYYVNRKQTHTTEEVI